MGRMNGKDEWEGSMGRLNGKDKRTLKTITLSRYTSYLYIDVFSVFY